MEQPIGVILTDITWSHEGVCHCSDAVNGLIRPIDSRTVAAASIEIIVVERASRNRGDRFLSGTSLQNESGSVGYVSKALDTGCFMCPCILAWVVDSVQEKVNTTFFANIFCQPCILVQQPSVPKCLEYGKADAEMASRVVCVRASHCIYCRRRR